MFTLGNLEFEVEYTELTGSFLDAERNKRLGYQEEVSFTWHLEIGTLERPLVTAEQDNDTREDEEDYEWVAPRLYHNNGFSLDIKSWKSIEGLTKYWDSTFNKKKEEAGTLYVFEHELLSSGKIEFLKRTGSIFTIRWSGTADVLWNDEFGEDVPFIFEGEVPFLRIMAGCDKICSLEELEPVISEFVNLNEYNFESEECQKIESGMAHCWKFTPKE